MIHGGDIYTNSVKLDFSVNINPLGPCKQLGAVMEATIRDIDKYPDISCNELTKELSDIFCVSGENIAIGNGASELFMGIVHAFNPKRVYMEDPCFYGYRWATNSIGAIIETKELTKDIQMIFIANPNNPTGTYKDAEELTKILEFAKNNRIIVVLDECFIELSDNPERSMTKNLRDYDNLIIVRAFTKSFAMPALRLGYLLCGDEKKVFEVKKHLPEWNVSGVAQKAGICALQNRDYLKDALSLIKNEREFLKTKLEECGIEVFPSVTNFLMIKSDVDLYNGLLKQGILIRDCSNFEGLSKGYYRIAVKKHEDNVKLIEAIGRIL